MYAPLSLLVLWITYFVCTFIILGENSVEETIKYIKEQFTSRKPPGKQMYMHISCAIDTATMKTLVDSVLEIIVELNLKKAAPF